MHVFRDETREFDNVEKARNPTFFTDNGFCDLKDFIISVAKLYGLPKSDIMDMYMRYGRTERLLEVIKKGLDANWDRTKFTKKQIKDFARSWDYTQDYANNPKFSKKLPAEVWEQMLKELY